MQMPDKPRTLKETIAAQEPAEQARLANAESFDDVTVSSPFHRQVTVIADRDCSTEWRVEYFDDDGGCYVTIFAGPASERRARDYFASLKSGRLKIQREPVPAVALWSGKLACLR
jgi:hypothetical protein